MNIGERIGDREKQLGLALEELGNRVGVSKSTVRKWEVGHIQNMRRDKIALLADELRISPTYLLGLGEDSTDDFDIFSIPNITPMPQIKKVPLLGNIACGVPILAEQNIEEYIGLPDSVKHADFCLKCQGDSMINARIYDGDIVFVRK